MFSVQLMKSKIDFNRFNVKQWYLIISEKSQKDVKQ